MNRSDFPTRADLDACLLADRLPLGKRVRGLKRRRDQGEPFDQGPSRVWQALEESRVLASRRRDSAPVPEFPPELPVSERHEEIAQAIAEHQVIVLCGETGSGKSTQLPKICLGLGRGVFGRIGHTQPRRIAARSLASRISAELGRDLSTTVGYKVRFHDRVRPETQIKLLTDGMLLAEIQQDRWLNEYDTLIIDEAHERSLNIDFLLGYLKQLLPKRPDLKLIVTSATIDPQRFAEHFGGAPIIEVSGRTYPVALRYRPPAEAGAGERDESLQQAIVDAVDELSGPGRGDILVFLSGEREIRETAEHLRKHKLRLTEVLPLYARLSPAEQGRVFQSHGGRRIVLATNVAETSLTVPGIRYVIDAGYARISRYSHRSKIQRLPVEPISQASANQRKGRCGRVAAGICIRLYEEEDFEGRREFTEPEIQRTNLASVILQMKVLGFGEIEEFPFLDPPDGRLIRDGYRTLEELGALGADRRVTRIGRELARLPVDPRIGRMLWAAAHGHCLREVLIIAAALSVQDPRDRPMDKQQEADEAHALFKHEDSDFLAYLALWDYLEEKRPHLSRRKFQQLCRQHFLSWTRVQEWHDIHQQLRAQLHGLGFKDNQAAAGFEEIHRALLTGLLSNIGFRDKEKEYQGARGSRFLAFPGSGLYAKPPKWVMAAEIVETAKVYARTLARTQPEWVESAAGHLVQRSYSEPHWQPKRGQVGAYEKVSLFGLTLVARRRVNYSPINPVESREIFIRFALVEEDFDTRAPFFRHNRELVAQVRDLEAKTRRLDLLADEQSRYEFYDKRIPPEACNGPSFEKWLRHASRTQPKLLHMRLGDLLRQPSGELGQDFPDGFPLGGMQLPLEYAFDPGQKADGVTLVLPIELVNQVPEERCQWLVPGLLRERVIALMRGLPKALRKSFVPIPDYADRCLAALQPSDRPLTQALAEQLKQLTGVHVPEDAWEGIELPEHLRMRFRLVDANGRTLDAGRDLQALKRRHRGQAKASFAQLPASELERDGIRDWDFGRLPESVELQRGGLRLRGFPALVDEGDSVSIRVLDSRPSAEAAGHLGLRRLLMLRLAQDVRYLRRNLGGLQRMQLQYAKAPKPPEGLDAGAGAKLEDELVALILDLCFIQDQPELRDGEAFRARIEQRRGELMTIGAAVCALAAAIFDGYQRLRKALSGATQINWLVSLSDMRQQLDRLVFRGFLAVTPYAELRHYPRYLQALEKRLEKLAHAAARDQKQLAELTPLFGEWQRRDQQARRDRRHDPRLEELRWMFEELRVSLFAQELKTAYPISLKRLERRWKELGL